MFRYFFLFSFNSCLWTVTAPLGYGRLKWLMEKEKHEHNKETSFTLILHTHSGHRRGAIGGPKPRFLRWCRLARRVPTKRSEVKSNTWHSSVFPHFLFFREGEWIGMGGISWGEYIHR